jgi:hypothetical protein
MTCKPPYKSYGRSKKSVGGSQKRKNRAGNSDMDSRLAYLGRKEIEESLRWLHDDQHHSWRWIAKYTIGIPRYGWLQRVAAGKQDCKPKHGDLLAVRRLYDRLHDQSDEDGKRLALSLEAMRLLGELNVTVSAIIKLSSA